MDAAVCERKLAGGPDAPHDVLSRTYVRTNSKLQIGIPHFFGLNRWAAHIHEAMVAVGIRRLPERPPRSDWNGRSTSC